MVFLDLISVITILLQGLLFGGILSLIAVGLTLIFGVSGCLNIAHGDFLVLGGIATAVLFTSSRINPFLSLIIVIPLFASVGVLLGILMRKPMSARTVELSLASSTLTTLGLSNFIEGLGNTIAPAYGYTFFTVASYSLGTVDILGVTLTNIFIVAFVTIIAISFAMTILVYRTSFGRLMRASIQDREVAIMLGADLARVSLITFAIGISLAALAGSIDVIVTFLAPSVGLGLTVDAFAVVVLGGLGSFTGSLIGGFVIGFSTSAVVVVLEELGQNGSQWAAAVPLAVLILILVVRPRGLLRR